jgi:hypothetical protein
MEVKYIALIMAITREDDFVSRAAGEWCIYPSG